MVSISDTMEKDTKGVPAGSQCDTEWARLSFSD